MTIYIFDGMAVLRRRFDNDVLGRGPRNVVTEMMNLPSTDIAVWCFEGKGSIAPRRKLFPKYKDRPSTMTDGLHALVNLTRDALKHTRALQVAVPFREADDVIAYLCQVHGTKDPVVVETIDGDLKALETPNVKVNCPAKRIRVDKLDSRKDVTLTAGEVHLYKTLVGDTSDCIPGMPGFGDKGFVACNRPFLQAAMLALLGGDPKPALFEHAGVKPAMAQRMCNPDQAEQLRVFWRITDFLPLPDDWDQHVVPGKPDWTAADKVLAEFMH